MLSPATGPGKLAGGPTLGASPGAWRQDYSCGLWVLSLAGAVDLSLELGRPGAWSWLYHQSAV